MSLAVASSAQIYRDLLLHLLIIVRSHRFLAIASSSSHCSLRCVLCCVHHSLLFEELLLMNADSRGVALTRAHAVALSWVKIPAPTPWHVTLLKIVEDASYMALCRLF
jgi:hypothetical protein